MYKVNILSTSILLNKHLTWLTEQCSFAELTTGTGTYFVIKLSQVLKYRQYNNLDRFWFSQNNNERSILVGLSSGLSSLIDDSIQHSFSGYGTSDVTVLRP